MDIAILGQDLTIKNFLFIFFFGIFIHLESVKISEPFHFKYNSTQQNSNTWALLYTGSHSILSLI